MARTPRKTAEKLVELYDETFAKELYEPFRINWPDLRGIAGVAKLTASYLRRVNKELNRTDYYLLQFDDFMAVLQECDLSRYRQVPSRLVEQYLYDASVDFDEDEDEEDDFIVDEQDVENIELDDEDEGLYVDEDEDSKEKEGPEETEK